MNLNEQLESLERTNKEHINIARVNARIEELGFLTTWAMSAPIANSAKAAIYDYIQQQIQKLKQKQGG